MQGLEKHGSLELCVVFCRCISQLAHHTCSLQACLDEQSVMLHHCPGFPSSMGKGEKGVSFLEVFLSGSSGAAELPAAAVFAPPCRALLVLTLHPPLLHSDNLRSPAAYT